MVTFSVCNISLIPIHFFYFNINRCYFQFAVVLSYFLSFVFVSNVEGIGSPLSIVMQSSDSIGVETAIFIEIFFRS